MYSLQNLNDAEPLVIYGLLALSLFGIGYIGQGITWLFNKLNQEKD